MHSLLVLLTVSIAVSLSLAAAQNVFNFEIPQWAEKQTQKTKFSDIINNLVGRYHHIQETDKQGQNIDLFKILMNGQKPKKLSSFKYKDCGGFAAKIQSIELKPDPLQFPGNLNVTASVELLQTLNAPLMVNMTVEKSGEPFLCNILPQYCHFDDVCMLLDTVTQCPTPLQVAGIPCKCPFQKNTYKLPPTSFEIDAEFLPVGDYHVHAVVYSGGKKAACVDLDVSIGY